MKYQFEIKEKIVDCLDCQFYDPILDETNVYAEHGWECWINKRPLNEPLAEKPNWCPLKEIDS